MSTTAFIAPVAKVVAELLQQRSGKRQKTLELTRQVEKHLENYISDILSWSSRIQFFGMSAAEETSEATIGLEIATEPRRLRGKASQPEMLSEIDLLQDGEHYLILGDPGSGKTTTLKRLVYAIVTQPAVTEGDIYRCPVLIRLREQLTNGDLYLTIADVLGVPYDLPSNDLWKVQNAKVGERRLVDVIPELLEHTNAVVMLDGLDEVPAEQKDLLERQVMRLAEQLQESKIIITSRSGDYRRHIQGFSTLELCPLSWRQVEAIAAKWIADPTDFLNRLNALPYKDVVDRPLLLAQLLVLYRKEGELPHQPALIYRRLIRLLLEEWDRDRRITRTSRYSEFDAERKMDFLAAMAYHLTYRLKAVRFSESDLIAAYSVIRTRFNLSAQEVDNVVQEVESHTGLIVNSAGAYEFSHLSLQEYLCAYHLVRDPMPEHINAYLSTYPAPVAVAVSLSAAPAAWLSALILGRRSIDTFSLDSLHKFLRRLWIEQPLFEVNRLLGIVILYLWRTSRGNQELRDTIKPFFEHEAARISILNALFHYNVSLDGSDVDGDIQLQYTNMISTPYDLEIPHLISVPAYFLEDVLRNSTVKVYFEHSINSEPRLLKLDSAGRLALHQDEENVPLFR